MSMALSDKEQRVLNQAPQPQKEIRQTHTKTGNGGGMHRTQSRHRRTRTTIRLITIFCDDNRIQTMNASNGEHESINQHVKTTLKSIEPYTLKALVLEDLRMHPKSLMSEIAERLPDVELNELRKMIYKMVGHELATTGGRTYRRHELSDGRKEKK